MKYFLSVIVLITFCTCHTQKSSQSIDMSSLVKQSLFYSCGISDMKEQQLIQNDTIFQYITFRFQKQLISGLVNEINKYHYDEDINDAKIVNAILPPGYCDFILNISTVNVDSLINKYSPSFYRTYKNPYYFYTISIEGVDGNVHYDCDSYFFKEYNPNKYIEELNPKEKNIYDEIRRTKYLIGVKKYCNFSYYPKYLFSSTDNFVFLSLSNQLADFNECMRNLFYTWYVFKTTYDDKLSMSEFDNNPTFCFELIPYIYLSAYTKYLPTTVTYLKNKNNKYTYEVYSAVEQKTLRLKLNLDDFTIHEK